MNKLYLTLLLLNNIASIVLIIMFSNSLILDVLFTILFIIMAILIIKRKKSIDLIDLIDLITLSIYMIFIISMFIFSIVFQTSNTKTFSMIYFSEFLIIPNLLVNIYNLFN